MKYLNRAFMYIGGIFLLALGGVLAIKSNLGASPISSLPLSISIVSNFSLGAAATLVFIIYVVIQIIILRKDFKLIQLLQIIFAILFGQLMNFFNFIINIQVENLYIRIFICVLSFFVTAFGVVFTITANFIPIAPEGLVQAISKKTKADFGKVKIYFDCSMVILSAVILLANNKSLGSLGIGTVLSAILVGKIVFIINKKLKDKLEGAIYTLDLEV